MKRNICNICGGNLINKNGRWVCEACGAFAPEEITNEEITLLYNASQKLRLGNFDDAEEAYYDITRQYPNNSDAYWGLVLSQYGIKYEKDYDGKMIPTCFNTSYQSLFENINYKKAYDLADNNQKKYFKSQADKIESVRKEWVEIASKEEPYDIFLSYKATEIDNNSKKTEDSVEAHEIYNFLVKLGYKVFFSKEALSDKTGEHYEPYIFNALNTCHVMIVYASKPEYVNSTWVRNEWIRYYKRIENKEKLDNSLVLIYKDFNPSDLSRPLANRQNFDRNDIRFADKLEGYLNRVISEAKKVIPHIDPITLKPFEAKNKKIETISKRKLESIDYRGDQSKIEILTRDIGSFDSPKLTSKAEDQLNLGYIYLKKNCFSDALSCFDGILVNNKTNAKALLGKLLAKEKITELNAFYNIDFSKFDNFDLLKKVIDYSTKTESEKILTELIGKVLEFVKNKQWLSAKILYLQICDYNTNSIQSTHEEIINTILDLNEFNKDSLCLIDCAIKFMLKNKDKYSTCVCSLISKLIDEDKIELAENYYNEASKWINDTRLTDARICLDAKNSELSASVVNLINSYDINKFELFIASINAENADHVLSLLSDAILTNFNNLNKINRSKYSKLLITYDFSKNEIFIKSLLNLVLLNPSKDNNEIFDVLLTTFKNENIDEMIDYIRKYSLNYLKIGEFKSANKYIDYALTYDQTNIELLKQKLIISVEAKQENEIWKNIFKIKDYSVIERMLSLCKTEDSMVNEILFLCNNCIKYIEFNKLDSNKNIYNVFDRLIRYYPESYNNHLLSIIQKMSDLCKQIGCFECAEKYYSMMTGLDSSEYKAYWGLLQSKLKCKNNNELIHQNILISTIPEFNNAIIAAGSNSQAIEDYIDCRTKQELWIKNQERKRKNRKKTAIISSILIPIIVVFITMYSLTKNVFIPNIKYDDALLLINNGNYQEAYDKLSGFNYKDSSNQLLIAQAGLCFEDGDYENGIQNFYNAGGTVEITYDSNGGEAPKTGETIKRLKSFVNNDPSLYGYSFYGWIIEDFSIDASYNQYLCDLKLKATWQIVNYTISYSLNGGTMRNFVYSYNCESEDIILEQPTKTGYTFVGWSGSGIETISKNVVISHGSVGNRNYEAHFDANEYTVTYDYGYDGISATDKATFDSQFNLEVPERVGYNFKGWLYNGTLFTDGIWKKDEDVTLTASWEPIVYSIIYDLNGGNCDITNPETYTIESNTITLNNPTKKGYEFLGWTGTEIESISKSISIVKGSIGNRYYYAHFEANNYTITYDYGFDNKTSTQTVKYGSNFELIIPNRIGYEFTGWTYNGKYISNGVWSIDDDVTLSATWSAKKYSISYTMNGGVNSQSNLNEYTIETPTFSLQSPTKVGYDFIGWSGTDIDDISKEVTIINGSTGDKSFTANWKVHTYKVVLDAQGGNCSSSSFEINYDEQLNLPEPSKVGYSFVGWFNSADDSLVSNGTWKYTSDLNLYAKWNLETYRISYILNGGTNSENNPHEYNVNSNDINISKPTKAGYTFTGWDSVLGDSEMWPIIVSGSTGDITFTANWTPNLNTYNIAYIGYGRNNDCIFSHGFQIKAYSDSIINLPSFDSKVPSSSYEETWGGYHFVGWSTTPYGNVKYLDEGEYNVGIDYSTQIHLYAQWEPNLNTITFNGNGADDGYMPQQSIYTDESANLNWNNFNRTGYTFAGWSTSPNGPVIYENNSTYTMGKDSNYDLYAVWTKNKYTIALNAVGGSINSTVATVEFDSDYQLEVPVRLGYTFLGWFDGTSKTSIQYTDEDGNSLNNWNVPNNDLVLYAKWEVSDEMKNFEFSVSGGNIKITGIKDASVTKIIVPDYVTEISKGAFKDCANLEEISLPFVGRSRTATNYEAVFGYIFDYTTSNTSHASLSSKLDNITSTFNINAVNNSENIPTGTTAQYAYYYKQEKASGADVYWLGATAYCYYIPQSLKKVTITDCGTIPMAAFLNCNMIEDIVLKGDNITIDKYAIYMCENLKTLTIDSHNMPELLGAISISNDSVILYVPEEMVAFYEADEHYSNFKSILEL